MVLSTIILFGIFRLCCLILLIFYVNKRWINKSKENTFLQFLIHQWFRYGSLIGIIIFIAVQLSIYNLLNCLLILSFIIFVDILGFRDVTHLEQYFHDKVKFGLHRLLKGIELKKSITSWLEFKKKDSVEQKGLLTFFLLLILIIINFISRSYLLKYDSYSLSNIWGADLMHVINFDNQNWFDTEMNVAGEMALVNFYSKIINISPEIALQSAGMLESLLIIVLLFWVTRFISFSKYFAPLVSALSFALLYTIIPLNLNYLLQPKSAFLSLSFVLPSMVYILKPKLLMLKKMNFFLGFLFIYFIIGLIDIFVLYILVPPFLFISIFLTKNRYSKKFWLGILAYFISALLIGGIYFLISYNIERDFLLFLHTNLVSVDSYTYIPQLIIPLNKLLTYYLLGAFIGILILLKFILYNKEDWKASLAFLIYFMGLIISLSIKSSWLDPDLIILSLTVFIPIMIGILVAIILRIIKVLVLKFENYKYYSSLAAIAVFVYLSISFQKNAFDNDEQSNKTNEEVLNVYNEIISNYFPFTYLVVNDYSTQVISENEHFFLNYSTFLDEYPAMDSIYFKNIKNPLFLKKHPEYIIPKSVFLFVYDGKDVNYFSDNNQFNPSLKKLMRELKKKGRRIELFSKNKNFKVYQIINEPHSSNISELIF
jgi:hypothetical protein